jgi:hypothetical protein
MPRHDGLAALLPLAALLLSGPLAAQDPGQEPEGEIGLICELGCSSDRERTATARLSWRQGDVPAGSRVDYAVYDEGFEIGGFASFARLFPGQDAHREFAHPEIESLRPFDLRLVQVEGDADEGFLSAVQLENLEAGVNYRFRLGMRLNGDWRSTETVVCPAPVCISDSE